MSNDTSKSIEDPSISLGLLEQIETNSGVTQRGLSNELGIALGLVNLYIKRCVKKGWIKASQAPANRYAYYLTPSGFQEKSRLAAEYLSSSLNFFRHARQQMNEVFAACHADGLRRIVLVGVSDLAEIAVLSSHEAPGVEVVAIVEASREGETFLGLPIVASIKSLNGIDGAVVTAMNDSQSAYDKIVADVAPACVRAPDFLRLTTALPVANELQAGE